MPIFYLIHELGKIEKTNQSNIQKPQFLIFVWIRVSLKYSLRPAFKNPSFESKDELKKLCFNVENKKENLHKTRLVIFQT